MTEAGYLAAKTVAPRVHAHFVRHRADARHRGHEPLASLPDLATIESMIDAAFWASLRREEGYVPKISLAFLSPEETSHPLLFEQPLPLAAGALTQVAPAVERAGIYLGVSPLRDGLGVWGTARTIPPVCFVLEVAAPGLLVVKYHLGDQSGKFVNVAVLEGDQVKVVDATSFLGSDSRVPRPDSVNLLVQLAVSMRGHRRGGLLLLVPHRTDSWRESIVRPISYALSPPFSELAVLRSETPNDERRGAWQEALARAVDAVGGLTAVDGATILTAEFDLLAFGAKIARRKGWEPIQRVTLTEPIEGGVEAVIQATQLGGTRHLSAAQFAHDQRDAVALVASQDGRFTIFAWSPDRATVHARRVDALLL